VNRCQGPSEKDQHAMQQRGAIRGFHDLTSIQLSLQHLIANDQGSAGMFRPPWARNFSMALLYPVGPFGRPPARCSASAAT
jgi:hypothetical protein